ncbi:MAG: hypothetical protein JWR38_4200 [Mucilaginibacter sp.]|nr:hypothetical protein [Mucilaginibacter sp.]
MIVYTADIDHLIPAEGMILFSKIANGVKLLMLLKARAKEINNT